MGQMVQYHFCKVYIYCACMKFCLSPCAHLSPTDALLSLLLSLVPFPPSLSPPPPAFVCGEGYKLNQRVCSFSHLKIPLSYLPLPISSHPFFGQGSPQYAAQTDRIHALECANDFNSVRLSVFHAEMLIIFLLPHFH